MRETAMARARVTRSDERARIIPKPYRRHVGEQHHSPIPKNLKITAFSLAFFSDELGFKLGFGEPMLQRTSAAAGKLSDNRPFNPGRRGVRSPGLGSYLSRWSVEWTS